MANSDEPETISVKGLTDEELVSPRFWEMRRLMVDYGRSRAAGASWTEKGDLVTVTGIIRQDPWIVMGIDEHGFYVLANGLGQILRCPTWAAPESLTIHSRASEALG